MLDAEDAGEAAAILGEPEMQTGEDAGLQKAQFRPERRERVGRGQEGLGVGGRLAHAAFPTDAARARTWTSTDFEVGVSENSPKAESGTSTLSSG